MQQRRTIGYGLFGLAVLAVAFVVVLGGSHSTPHAPPTPDAAVNALFARSTVVPPISPAVAGEPVDRYGYPVGAGPAYVGQLGLPDWQGTCLWNALERRYTWPAFHALFASDAGQKEVAAATASILTGACKAP